ncbi:Uroporphyrinogen decarboxylase [Punctularia strigosozonata HHB-11173 SS5]|uniref:Uroporphyrinogen decarboxylase n=1 Tax=Punctularia strigosozonata (strain HHB-11173) TaxID=741275 RepID=UPI00044168E2|nr:Uroporphyrinogen decarboxylase [Punctularia strigosozonata HHB-11173 SS5]EIN10936.1 Uroporphyrinogen decarboxylase [Punctularia strigosozonata HHB-11173 SS5]
MSPSEDFPPLKNTLLLQAARREKTQRAPVWLVRQAARYLPEFMEIRKSHEFFEICKTPSLACEVTMQPIRRYTGILDGAIIFGDILVIPQVMGMTVEVKLGPYFPDPLQTPSDLRKLKMEVEIETALEYMLNAISLTRRRLEGEVPVIGFTGAPWTLLVLMTGGGSQTQKQAKRWLYSYPQETATFLGRLAEICIDFLVAQVQAGAQFLQIFESFTGDLTMHHLHNFSFPSLRRIASGVHDRLREKELPVVPLSLFAKGASHALAEMADLGFDVISVDHTVDLVKCREVVGDRVALHGNIDPMVLFAGKDAIEREVKRVCDAVAASGGDRGWIAGLSHGVPDGADAESVRHLLECIRQYSAT